MQRLQSDWGRLSDRLMIRRPTRSQRIACVHSRAYTCVNRSAHAPCVYFKRSVTMQLHLVRVLHRASILMNSRKRHSRSGFFVTSLKGHSKWIVREVVMDPAGRSWKAWKQANESRDWRNSSRGLSFAGNSLSLPLCLILLRVSHNSNHGSKENALF